MELLSICTFVIRTAQVVIVSVFVVLVFSFHDRFVYSFRLYDEPTEALCVASTESFSWALLWVSMFLMRSSSSELPLRRIAGVDV